MTASEKVIIKCAFADLCGAVQARNQHDVELHDWDAHVTTIEELAEKFSFLGEIPDLE